MSAFFARTFCETEFLNHGIKFNIKQSNTSFNQHAYTLRGMHFQQSPKAEAKLIRCTARRIFDIALDLRADSPSYCNWYGTELSAKNAESLYIPKGCTHGFLSLVNNSKVLYLMDENYSAELASGVRFNDPAFKIILPTPSLLINLRG
ncbi:MAG: dTDP-4-dehydrorhamnose 3,5-epimerase family protein [Methylococcaceae bacterium]